MRDEDDLIGRPPAKPPEPQRRPRMRALDDPATREKFLRALRETANLSKAAQIVAVPRQIVYAYMATNKELREEVEHVRAMAIEELEDECMRRALEGYEEPVYQGGELVGYRRKFSDQLAMFLLRAHKPEKYREQVDVNVGLTEDLAKRIDRARARVIEAQAVGHVGQSRQDDADD